MRLVAVVLALVACSRQSERPTAATAGSGSAPALAVTPVAADAAPTPTSPTKVLDESCPPRARTRDPGPTKPGSPHGLGPPSEVAEVKDACVKHAECTERAHGRCVHQDESVVQTFGTRRTITAHNECVYDDCTSDDECRRTGAYEPRAELACMCAADRNVCTFANCRKDSDCPSPFTCGGWHYCHSAADGCRETKDCPPGEDCIYSWDVNHYICKHQTHIAPD